MLAAASAYFNAMFTSDVLEAKREQIVIQSLDSPTLASLLDFMYTGQIKVKLNTFCTVVGRGDKTILTFCHFRTLLHPSIIESSIFYLKQRF